MSQELIAVGTSDKESLEILKKYCTEDACFQGMKYDDTILEYYNVTSEVLDKEIAKETPDHSIVQTLAANLVLILGNCERAAEQKPKKGSKDPITFTYSDYDASSAIKHINRYWDFTGNHDRAIQQEKKISDKWRRKRIAIVLLSLFCVLSIVVLIIARFKVGEYSSKAKNHNDSFIDKIIPWGDDNDQIKQSQEMKNRAAAVSYVAIACIFLSASISIFIMYRNRKKLVSIEKEKAEWRNYFLLCRLFETTEHKIKEGQKTWSGQ